MASGQMTIEDETTVEQERIRAPRKGHDRQSVPPLKAKAKAARHRAATNELHARIIGVLQLLVGRGEIEEFAEEKQRPYDQGVTVTFRVIRPGKVEPVERRFFASYDLRLVQLVASAPPAENAPRVAGIAVTREMRNERIVERILALFNN